MQSKNSISRLKTFQQCERRYEFRYVRKLPELAGDRTRLNIGLCVHEGLEYVAKEVMGGAKLEPKLLAKGQEVCYMASDKKFPCSDVLDEIQAGYRAGWDCLDFLLAEGHEILGAEIGGTMVFGQWSAPYRIDLVTRLDGLLYVLDWKTTGSMPQNTSDAVDPQTSAYAYAMMDQYGEDECVAGRAYLRVSAPNLQITAKGKVSLQSSIPLAYYKEYIERHPEHALPEGKAEAKFGTWYRIDEGYLTKDECAAILQIMAQISKRATQTTDYLPNFDARGCGWCPYQKECKELTLFGEIFEQQGIEIS